MTGHYEIHRSKLRRKWWVRSVGANGEPLSHSEMLSSYEAALANVEAQRGLVDAPIEDRT